MDPIRTELCACAQTARVAEAECKDTLQLLNDQESRLLKVLGSPLPSLKRDVLDQVLAKMNDEDRLQLWLSSTQTRADIVRFYSNVECLKVQKVVDVYLKFRACPYSPLRDGDPMIRIRTGERYDMVPWLQMPTPFRHIRHLDLQRMPLFLMPRVLLTFAAQLETLVIHVHMTTLEQFHQYVVRPLERSASTAHKIDLFLWGDFNDDKQWQDHATHTWPIGKFLSAHPNLDWLVVRQHVYDQKAQETPYFSVARLLETALKAARSCPRLAILELEPLKRTSWNAPLGSLELEHHVFANLGVLRLTNIKMFLDPNLFTGDKYPNLQVLALGACKLMIPNPYTQGRDESIYLGPVWPRLRYLQVAVRVESFGGKKPPVSTSHVQIVADVLNDMLQRHPKLVYAEFTATPPTSLVLPQKAQRDIWNRSSDWARRRDAALTAAGLPTECDAVAAAWRKPVSETDSRRTGQVVQAIAYKLCVDDVRAELGIRSDEIRGKTLIL